MELNCGPTASERRTRALASADAKVSEYRRLVASTGGWRRRFALIPRRVASGKCIWLGWYEFRYATAINHDSFGDKCTSVYYVRPQRRAINASVAYDIHKQIQVNLQKP